VKIKAWISGIWSVNAHHSGEFPACHHKTSFCQCVVNYIAGLK